MLRLRARAVSEPWRCSPVAVRMNTSVTTHDSVPGVLPAEQLAEVAEHLGQRSDVLAVLLQDDVSRDV